MKAHEKRASDGDEGLVTDTGTCPGLGIRSSDFSSDLLVFCEQKSERAIRLWKGVNPSCCSFVKSDRSELLKKSKWSKSDERDCQKRMKNTNFWANRSFFASNLLELPVNYSHRSFLQSSESVLLTPLFFNDDFLWRDEQSLSWFGQVQGWEFAHLLFALSLKIALL